jgi:hypothetical protein
VCRSSSFPLQASATSDLRFARDPVRRIREPGQEKEMLSELLSVG